MKHITEFDSPGSLLDYLRAGNRVRSVVPGEGDGPPYMGRNAYLTAADTYCNNCRCIIFPADNYGQGWGNVLARQKVEYDGTYCQACFEAGEHEQDTSDGDSDDDSDDRNFR